MSRTRKVDWFARYTWFFLGYLIFVILFGAWVRITHSGAGCGSHWPTCHGEVIPFEPSVETMIEYTHRLTSGFLGILGIVLLVWAFRRFGATRVFWACVASFVFIIFEALIGAGLVLGELVGSDDSVARAVVISLHLVNTLILTGATGLAAWWASDTRRFDWHKPTGALRWLLVVGLLGIIATSMSGAVTALGDTLFPVDPTQGAGLFERVREDLSPAKHFLVRLRILHPIIASVVAVFLVLVSNIIRMRDVDSRSSMLALSMLALVLVQVGVGFVNIALAAPGWLQLVHLLLAQGVWLAAVLTTVSIHSVDPA